MKVIGLTGGIGSGKSTVAVHFNKLGVPVYIADDASKKVLNSDPEAIKQVALLLGDEAYVKDDNDNIQANRKFIASQVFQNKELLEKLNKILHPLVRVHFKNWLSETQATYVIYEAAILFESGGDKYCDKTILVWSSEKDRIERVMHRDNVNEAEVTQRLKNQWSDIQRLEKANYVIVNNDLHKIPDFVKTFNQFMLND